MFSCLERLLIYCIINRDKTSPDITWIKDKSLADLDNLPEPDDDNRAQNALDSIAIWMKYNNRSIYGCKDAPENFSVPETLC